MDAVHLMRAITGRDLIIKVEGCYHGHHDSVQVSVCPERRRDRARPTGPPASRPAPASRARITDLTLIVGFNDLDGVDRGCWTSTRARSPGMILEPIMMNAGIIQPEPGYLAGAEGPAARPRRAARPSTRSRPG